MAKQPVRRLPLPEQAAEKPHNLIGRVMRAKRRPCRCCGREYEHVAGCEREVLSKLHIAGKILGTRQLASMLGVDRMTGWNLMLKEPELKAHARMTPWPLDVPGQQKCIYYLTRQAVLDWLHGDPRRIARYQRRWEGRYKRVVKRRLKDMAEGRAMGKDVTKIYAKAFPGVLQPTAEGKAELGRALYPERDVGGILMVTMPCCDAEIPVDQKYLHAISCAGKARNE